MEPVTHFLFGACLSRAGLNRKTGLATLTLTLAAEAADTDVVAYFGGSVAGFEHHRGITHTFLGVPFVAGATLAGVFGIYRIMRSRGWQPKLAPDWKILYVYALLGALSHIGLDFLNNYGVRPLAPFHPQWYSWDIVFIVDPFILALLICGLTMPAFLGLITDEMGGRKPEFRGRGAARFALVGILALITFRAYEHRRAVNALESLTYHDEPVLRASAYPTMLNPFAWHGVVETPSFLQAVKVNAAEGEVDPDNSAISRHKPDETPVSLAAKKSRLGRVYLDWAQYPYVETTRLPEDKGYQIQFQDWRFLNEGIGPPGSAPPLSGNVILDNQLQVTDMYVGRTRKH